MCDSLEISNRPSLDFPQGFSLAEISSILSKINHKTLTPVVFINSYTVWFLHVQSNYESQFYILHFIMITSLN